MATKLDIKVRNPDVEKLKDRIAKLEAEKKELIAQKEFMGCPCDINSGLHKHKPEGMQKLEAENKRLEEANATWQREDKSKQNELFEERGKRRAAENENKRLEEALNDAIRMKDIERQRRCELEAELQQEQRLHNDGLEWLRAENKRLTDELNEWKSRRMVSRCLAYCSAALSVCSGIIVVMNGILLAEYVWVAGVVLFMASLVVSGD